MILRFALADGSSAYVDDLETIKRFRSYADPTMLAPFNARGPWGELQLIFPKHIVRAWVDEAPLSAPTVSR